MNYIKGELSKKRRLEIYKGALKVYENAIKDKNDNVFGFCNTFRELLKTEEFYIDPYRAIGIYFPEIYEQWNGKAPSGFWFSLNEDGLKKRITFLENAIKKLSKNGTKQGKEN